MCSKLTRNLNSEKNQPSKWLGMNDSTVSYYEWLRMVQWHRSIKKRLDCDRDFCKGLLLFFFLIDLVGCTWPNEHISCIWQAETAEPGSLCKGQMNNPLTSAWGKLSSNHSLFSRARPALWGKKKLNLHIISRSNLMLHQCPQLVGWWLFH